MSRLEFLVFIPFAFVLVTFAMGMVVSDLREDGLRFRAITDELIRAVNRSWVVWSMFAVGLILIPATVITPVFAAAPFFAIASGVLFALSFLTYGKAWNWK